MAHPHPQPAPLASWLTNSVAEAGRVLSEFAANRETLHTIEALAQHCVRAFRAGGKVLICGNGGSLCDAVHFAEELTGRFRADRPPLPAIAIAEPGHITCTANDYGFDQVFSRAITALGKPGDVLILLSTSGNSANILNAAQAGRASGLVVIGLLGKGGGAVRSQCNLAAIFPGDTSDRIQELHMLALHTVVEGIELALSTPHTR